MSEEQTLNTEEVDPIAPGAETINRTTGAPTSAEMQSMGTDDQRSTASPASSRDRQVSAAKARDNIRKAVRYTSAAKQSSPMLREFCVVAAAGLIGFAIGAMVTIKSNGLG